MTLSNVDIQNCEIKDGRYLDYSETPLKYFSLSIENSKIKLDNIEYLIFKSCSFENLKATNIDNINLNENNEFIKSLFNECYFNEIIH